MARGTAPGPQTRRAKGAPHGPNGVYVFAMKGVFRRIRRLEDRFASAGEKGLLVVTSCVTLALDKDTCVEILRECGFVPSRGIGASSS